MGNLGGFPTNPTNIITLLLFHASNAFIPQLFKALMRFIAIHLVFQLFVEWESDYLLCVRGVFQRF